jgi:hypothetical protein
MVTLRDHRDGELRQTYGISPAPQINNFVREVQAQLEKQESAIV